MSTFIAGLEGGQAYANIHYATFLGGEIRGLLPAVPLPGALPLFATGLAGLGLLGLECVVVFRWRKLADANARGA